MTTATNHTTSRKELYSGSMVIFLGFFYFVLLIAGFLYRPSSEVLGFNDIKHGILSIFFVTSGIVFFKKKPAGWILTTGILLNFVLVCCVIILSFASHGEFNLYAALQLMLFFLFLLAFIFLLNKETRKKYQVNNKSYLLALTVYVIVISAYFLL